MRKLAVMIILISSGIMGFILSLYLHQKDDTDVQMIQTFHYPSLFVSQLAGDKHVGEKIFKEFCVSCHGKQPFIDVHAPRINDKKAWKTREKMGIPTLLKLTIDGVGAMPARGGCFECSDEQLRETIQYILIESH
jgi:cytochrome c5